MLLRRAKSSDKHNNGLPEQVRERCKSRTLSSRKCACVIEALAPDQEYPCDKTYVQTQLGVASVLIAAYFCPAGGFATEDVINNLDHLAEQASGFASGCVMTLIPWFAGAEVACGVYFGRQNPLARRPGWAVKDCLKRRSAEHGVKDAGHLEPSPHQVPY